MSERAWAWLIWFCCPLAIAVVAFYTLGAGLVFLIPWWVGGPFYITREDCGWGPYWDPPRTRNLWWRKIR